VPDGCQGENEQHAGGAVASDSPAASETACRMPKPLSPGEAIAGSDPNKCLTPDKSAS
jgi:hypothetical protein